MSLLRSSVGDVTVHDVERTLKSRRARLSITEDGDGYFVTLTRSGRRFTGLSDHLLSAIIEAIEESDVFLLRPRRK